MSNRYRQVVKGFRDRRLLIIGDIILDSYTFGRVNRISPEAPVPVVEVVEESYRLGGSANVAHNIASLGAEVSLVGLIGQDKEAEILLRLCRDKGIDTSGIFTDKRPTTVKTRVIAHQQQVVRIDREVSSAVDRSITSKLTTYLKNNLDHFDGIIISDYKKGIVSEELVKSVVRLAKGRFIALDPKVGNFHCYKGVSIITPNLREASEGSGVMIKDEQSLLKSAQVLMKRLSLRSLLITKGERGMSLFQRDGSGAVSVTHIPAMARKVYDVTGAGDTVIAVFTLAHLSGADLIEAAVIANCAAGMVVAEVGTAVVTPEALLKGLSTVTAQ